MLECGPFVGLPLSTNILFLNGHTGHLPQPDTRLDVSKLQAQVFPQDGHPGSPLTRSRLRVQLEKRKDIYEIM